MSRKFVNAIYSMDKILINNEIKRLIMDKPKMRDLKLNLRIKNVKLVIQDKKLMNKMIIKIKIYC